MMGNDRRVEEKLGKFTVPTPGELVRTRALAAGKEALAGRKPIMGWDRIWFSPVFRLAWSAAVLLLAAGHVLLSTGGADRTVSRDVVTRIGMDRQDTELIATLEMHALDRQARSGLDLERR